MVWSLRLGRDRWGPAIPWESWERPVCLLCTFSRVSVAVWFILCCFAPWACYLEPGLACMVHSILKHPMHFNAEKENWLQIWQSVWPRDGNEEQKGEAGREIRHFVWRMRCELSPESFSSRLHPPPAHSTSLSPAPISSVCTLHRGWGLTVEGRRDEKVSFFFFGEIVMYVNLN